MAPTRFPFHSMVPHVSLRHPDDDQGDTGTGDDAGDQLGEAGQKALAEERRARRAAEKAAKEREATAAALQAEVEELRKKTQTDDERKIAEAVEAARKAAVDELSATHAAQIAAAERKLVGARLVAMAAGKLTAPADAGAFINIDDLERDADGNVTDDTLMKAVEDLRKEKPYLAARAGGGSADQGQRRDAGPDFKDPKQLNAELAKLGVKPR